MADAIVAVNAVRSPAAEGLDIVVGESNLVGILCGALAEAVASVTGRVNARKGEV